VLPRTRAALAAVAAVTIAGASVNAVAARATAQTPRNVVTALPVLDAAILAEINAARGQHGLARLHFSPPLRAAAALHSYDMAQHGFFSHDSRSGTSPWTRLARFYPARHRQIGETLLWSVGSVRAATVVREWLSSPEHSEILFSASFRDLGVAAVHATAAPGAFAGGQVTLVTADFGAR
jgi:uncharacterized protein YkwD